MPYATQQDIVDRYGADQLLLIADRNVDGAVDADVVDQALADATAEIDVYLASKYTLPLSTVPTVLQRLCVDIVMYRLASEADAATEERRQRFEDALQLLVRISRGEVSLGLPEPPSSSTGAAVYNGTERRFTRQTMRRLT